MVDEFQRKLPPFDASGIFYRPVEMGLLEILRAKRTRKHERKKFHESRTIFSLTRLAQAIITSCPYCPQFKR